MIMHMGGPCKILMRRYAGEIRIVIYCNIHLTSFAKVSVVLNNNALIDKLFSLLSLSFVKDVEGATVNKGVIESEISQIRILQLNVITHILICLIIAGNLHNFI